MKGATKFYNGKSNQNIFTTPHPESVLSLATYRESVSNPKWQNIYTLSICDPFPHSSEISHAIQKDV